MALFSFAKITACCMHSSLAAMANAAIENVHVNAEFRQSGEQKSHYRSLRFEALLFDKSSEKLKSKADS